MGAFSDVSTFSDLGHRKNYIGKYWLCGLFEKFFRLFPISYLTEYGTRSGRVFTISDGGVYIPPIG